MNKSRIMDIAINDKAITNKAFGPVFLRTHKSNGKSAYNCTITEKNHQGPDRVSASFGINPYNKVNFSTSTKNLMMN